jgi:hypothetical protein
MYSEPTLFVIQKICLEYEQLKALLFIALA